MSFILDALKKADAERNLGGLPGIHSQQIVGATLPAARSGWRSHHAYVVMSCGAAVVVIVAGGWQLGIGRRAAVPGIGMPLVASTATPVTMPAQSEIASVAAPATELPVPRERIVLRKAPSVVIPTKDAAPAARKSLPVAEHLNAGALVDLPPAIQREIPPFAISGSMYSTNPADRMLLVDKRMLHEGDEVAPGLILDRVLPRGAILRYKGHVFRVSN
ncbi:MAG: general secretion pathway protein GspB [Herminiimonas sp.]|nr:general secretion pathway protein GspB [Herminiimonas sp.]